MKTQEVNLTSEPLFNLTKIPSFLYRCTVKCVIVQNNDMLQNNMSLHNNVSYCSIIQSVVIVLTFIGPEGNSRHKKFNR